MRCRRRAQCIRRRRRRRCRRVVLAWVVGRRWGRPRVRQRARRCRRQRRARTVSARCASARCAPAVRGEGRLDRVEVLLDQHHRCPVIVPLSLLVLLQPRNSFISDGALPAPDEWPFGGQPSSRSSSPARAPPCCPVTASGVVPDVPMQSAVCTRPRQLLHHDIASLHDPRDNSAHAVWCGAMRPS